MAKSFLAPKPPRRQEKAFAAAIEQMIGLMARLYRNQTLGALTAKDVDKFADAVGNFGAVWESLTRKVERKIRARFDDDRIEQLANDLLTETDKATREQFYKALGAAIGVDTGALLASEGLSNTRNALIIETAQWVKRLRDETLENWTANTLRSMALGQSLEQIMQQFDGMAEERRNHARFIARTQIGQFTGLMSKMRAQKLGITKAVWIASKDERTRPSHADRDGVEFDLSEGCYSSKDRKYLIPGVDYNCRCVSRMVLPDE